MKSFPASRTLVVSLLLSLVTATLLGQPKLSDAIPVAKDIHIGKLSNGFTYYIRKNTRPEKKVELRLVVKAGSILEDDDQQGLAHFTEHMSFNGTKHFQKNELVSFLQDMGIKFGADLNAYTSFDETVYILPVPVDKKENLEKGLLVLEDWASTVGFEDAEIDKERSVVLEESRLGKGANDRINKVLFPKLFEGSKYAQRLPIGKEDILKNFKYESIKRFYRDWYRPDLMAAVVVGDIDPAETENMIKAHFEKLKGPGTEKPRSYAEIPVMQKTEALIITDPEATNSILRMNYSFSKEKDQTTVGDYRQYMLKSLFQSMVSQRMQELTQKSNPPFVFGGISLSSFIHGYEAFSSFALIGQSGAESAITALVQEDERARKFGFTSTELDRTKKNLMKGMERAYNERDKTESDGLAEELINNFLEKEPIPGIEGEYAYYQQFLEGISLDEVNQFAAKIIPSSGNKLVVLTCPEKVDFPIPTKEQLLAYVDKAASTEIKAYEEKAVAAALIATPPAAGKIISEKEEKQAGFSELTLSNGVKVILKSTDFKNDQVVMSGFRYGGQFLYGAEDRYNAEFASQVVSQMGVGPFSPTDLKKVLAGKTVSVTPRIGTISEGVSGQSSANDIESMLQLTYLYFTQPRLDDELFKSFVSKQQSLYQNMMSDPQTVFRDSVLKIVYNNHPRAPKLPRVETFAKIDEQRAFDIYKERFSNAQGYTFVLVGKIDLVAIKPLLATYLGSLPSTGKPSAFKDAGVRPVHGVVKKEVRKGTEPKSFIVMQFTGEAPYSDEETLRLQAVIEVLNIKIIETLREDMGGIYGGGMYGSLNKNPYNNYSIGVSLPCGPENVEKLINATLEEIQKIKISGPLEADLNKVKENWKKQYEENIRDNSYWLRQLQQVVEIGSHPSDILAYEKKVDALTVKELKETANKYFNMKNYIQVVLYPEK